MRADLNGAVSKYPTYIFVLFSILLSGAACATSAAAEAASRLARVANEIDNISIYWVSRTENYSLEGDKFKEASSIQFSRKCGANCRRLLGPVLEHLSRASSAKCTPGQQNVALYLGDKVSIIYSYSGRLIKVNNDCYFNETGVNAILKNPQFLFK